MRLLIATDAWKPQVNGVVRSLEHIIEQAPDLGVEVRMLTPDEFRSIPMPGYPEIRLSLASASAAARAMDAFHASHVHIATEGPLGLAVRRACLREDRPFTTSFTPAFRNMWRPAPPCPRLGAMRRCAGSTMPAVEPWRARPPWSRT